MFDEDLVIKELIIFLFDSENCVNFYSKNSQKKIFTQKIFTFGLDSEIRPLYTE